MSTKTTAARDATRRIIRRYERGLADRASFAVRDVALLRRAVGRDPEDCPEVLGIVAGEIEEKLRGDGWVSDTERAVFTAITLWALHSQSSTVPSYDASTKDTPAPNIGQAVRTLVHRETGSYYGDHSIMRHWHYLIAADTVDLFAARARSIVTQLRREGIGFDYVDLAGALVHWDTYPENRKRVLVRWSRPPRADKTKTTK